jgi:hypothetical protein
LEGGGIGKPRFSPVRIGVRGGSGEKLSSHSSSVPGVDVSWPVGSPVGSGKTDVLGGFMSRWGAKMVGGIAGASEGGMAGGIMESYCDGP